MPNTTPLISVKAGRCIPSARDPKTIVPAPQAGLLYLYNDPEDDFLHFCWRPLTSNVPEEDLIIVPSNATFVRYPVPSGRIFVLKFLGSSQRHFYWLQTQPGDPENPGHFSARDEEVERTINRLLKDEDEGSEDLMEDDDDAMEDVERRGDGADARDGGADGGRAPDPFVSTPSTTTTADIRPASRTVSFADRPTDIPSTPSRPANPASSSSSAPETAEAVYLRNLLSSITVPDQASQQTQASTSSRSSRQPPLSLPILLAPSTTLPIVPSLSTAQLDTLISLLPPGLFPTESNPDFAQKKVILERVLRSAQFTQALSTLTGALRDEGALRSISDSLGVNINDVAQEVRRNGGDLVGGYVHGVRKTLENEREEQDGDRMQE